MLKWVEAGGETVLILNCCELLHGDVDVHVTHGEGLNDENELL